MVSLALALVLVFGLTVLLGSPALGRQLRAVAESPDTARLLGIHLPKLIPAVFVVAGLLSALAGVLFALNYQQVSPLMGDEIASFAMAAMVVGGLGDVWGAIAGGLLPGLLEVLAIFFSGAKVIKLAVWGVLGRTWFFPDGAARLPAHVIEVRGGRLALVESLCEG